MIFIFTLLMGWTQMAQATTTILGPVSLDLPQGWACQTQELNYICLDQSATSQKNSAIVVTYKRRAPEDTLVVYRDQLARPRNLYKGDVAIPSQPRGVSERDLNGVTWVEGIHFGSEVPNYYTHYYAVGQDPWAILVAFSIEKSAYGEALPKFQNIVASLKLVDLKDTAPIAATAAAVDGSAEPTFVSKPSGAAKIGRIEILGYSLPRMYVAMAVGLIVVMGLLGYALLSE